ITIQLDEDRQVADARFHVAQYRGFEEIDEALPFYEMPGLMGRNCGICTISHSLASALACDEIMGVRVPDTAVKLRKIINYASILQSHALSFYYLSAPHFLVSMESDPPNRSLLGLLQSHPNVARDDVALRRIRQQVIEWLAG